ncbi:MAG: rRNA maturation RNase YbeY [Firmicutes bacterium]|nr:rRNA maturation RNase YbeY [Bacillota bacterium]
MRLLFDNDTDFEFSGELMELLKSVIEETLKSEKFEHEAEISLSIVDNEEIRSINSKYRSIDKETDVLSFPQFDFNNEEVPENAESVMLGDIIISIEKAQAQAEEYGHSIERELSFLTAHSMLHLLGYDHEESEEEKIMFEKQDKILDKLGIRR